MKIVLIVAGRVALSQILNILSYRILKGRIVRRQKMGP